MKAVDYFYIQWLKDKKEKQTIQQRYQKALKERNLKINKKETKKNV